jgi:DHA2 family multidrug resistance protein
MDTHWKPTHSPWLVSFSVLLATFIAVLDTSVANVALPHIAGNLSASTDEATWVLTSYLVATAIVLAATSWLSSYFGRKNYLMFSVALFTASSALCGMAQTLPQLILARIMQGIGAGGLQPLAQAIMIESFSVEERGAAMAAYGMGIIVAPIIGPTLGGWITDNYSWRWIFYINVPIGIIGIFLQNLFVEDPPYFERSRHKAIDYIGLTFMVLALASLQIVLDKGQELDWFANHWIRFGTGMVIVFLPLFVWWECTHNTPFINLRLLKNRNLAVGTGLAAMQGLIMYASTAMLPIFMQQLLKYPALQSGLAMTPRGIGSMASMIIIGRIVNKVENRLLMVFGYIGLGATCLAFANLNMDIARTNIIVPQIFNGFSMGFLFVPMTVLTMSTLRQNEINQATGIMNLWRNIGSSIGISVVFAYQTRMAQVHQAMMVSNVSAYTPSFQQWAGHLTSLGATPMTAYALAYSKVVQQSTMLAFIDAFRWLTVLSFLCIPLVFLFKKHKLNKPAPLEAECFEM